MRRLPIIATLVLGAALTAALSPPAAAGPRGAGFASGWVNVRPARVDRGGAHWGERHKFRRPERRRRQRALVYPYYYRGDDFYRRYEAPSAPQPVPAPPVVEAPVAPPEPLDPRGPLRLSPARGIVPDATPYVVGEQLPAGLPHVSLDWRRFDLPEPPPGRLYARVGRDVLLITATGRIVEGVLPPG